MILKSKLAHSTLHACIIMNNDQLIYSVILINNIIIVVPIGEFYRESHGYRTSLTVPKARTLISYNLTDLNLRAS